MASSDHTVSKNVLFERAVCIAAFGLDKADSVPPLFDRSKWRFGWSPEVIAGLRRLVAWLVAQGAQARAFVDDGRQFNHLRWMRLQEVLEQDRAEGIFEAFRLICREHGLALGLDDPLLGMDFREFQLARMAKRFMDEVQSLAGEAWVDLQGFPAQVSENGNSGQPAPASKAPPLQTPLPQQPEPAEPEPEKPPEPESVETASGAQAQPEPDKKAVQRLMRYVRNSERLMRDVRKRWSGEGPDLTYDIVENILRNDHSDLRERKGSLKSSLERAVRNLRNEDEAQRTRASPDSPSDSPSTPDNRSKSPSDGSSTLGNDPSDTPS
jgi:hypothetical protein